MISDINFNPHFIYPYLLLLMPMWLIAVYGYNRLWKNKNYNKKHWDALIDKPLQPFVISGYKDSDNGSHKDSHRTRTTVLVALAGLIALLALSGPSLHKRQLPLYEDQQGLVIALDLSASMLAQDVQPNRLQRAKFAVIDLLKQRKTGYAALVVFAGDAFAVSPLTNDVETIFAQLTHMSPSIMPTQGSRLDKAIIQSMDLLSNTGYYTGKILLVTDGLSNLSKSIDAASLAHDKGYEVSILAIGTEAGATIPVNVGDTDNNHQVLLNKNGDKVIATLNAEDLQAVVKAGNGLLLLSTVGDSNISTLLNRYKAGKKFGTNDTNTLEFPINAGIWLLFPVLLLVLLLFRRGLIWVVCVIVLLPVNEVYAANPDWNWDSLWLNSQQQARKILAKTGSASSENGSENGSETSSKKSSENNRQNQRIIQTIQAEQVFTDNSWKAATAYRAKNYPLAVELYSQEDSADAWYNKGNALARMHNLEDAIKAYQIALEKQPDHSDASFNLKLVRKRKQEMANADPKDNPILELIASANSSTENNVNNKMLQSTEPQQLSLQIQQRKEQRAFDKQWLNSIPDDPSGLWRRKFSFQYKAQYQKQYMDQSKKLFKLHAKEAEEQQW